MEKLNAIANLVKNDMHIMLSLSLCHMPVSIDDVVSWGIASPKKLWFLLSECKKNNYMIEMEKPNQGVFQWINSEIQTGLILSCSIDDWKNILIHESIIILTIELLNHYVKNNDRKMMMGLFKGLVNSKHPDKFPLGKIGYMKIVSQSCSFFLLATWRDEVLIENAIKIAIAHNQSEVQAIFYGQLSTYALYAGKSDLAKKYIEESISISNQLQNKSLYDGANLAYAATMVSTGHIMEGIAIFEEFLGDVPEDILIRLENIFESDPEVPVQLIGMLGLAYSCLGQPNRSIDILYRTVRRGEKAGRKSVVYLASQFIALTYLAYDEIKPAKEKARSIFNYWIMEGSYGYPQALWGSTVLLAALLLEEKKPDEAIEILSIGDKARRESNFLHFYGRSLLTVLEWLEINGYSQTEGLNLNSEIERNLSWPDKRMQGVANYFAARRAVRDNEPEDAFNHYSLSCKILREVGVYPDLIRALTDFSRWEYSRGNSHYADELLTEANYIKTLITPLILPDNSVRISHENIAMKILELGRLFTFPLQLTSLWGELAAKICAQLGAERCIIIEAGNPKHILALRGGGKSWADKVLELISSSEFTSHQFLTPPWNDDDMNEQGQFLIVPFNSLNLNRNGWVGLENRHTMPMITDADVGIPEALGHQMTVLFENSVMWKNLQEVQSRLDRENKYYRQNIDASQGSRHILGNSKAILYSLNLVKRVAKTNTTVLITGETGVGKELFARELHNLSDRKSGPFITVHIASMASGLVSSELFGHEKGAFTGAFEQSRGRFELANNGIIFLDEIGELTLEDQTKILRVLQEGTFERVGGNKIIHSDFRLIAATNRDLKDAVKKGIFREDLYYRLNVFPIDVPPLRERKEDIPMLSLFFMEQCNRKLGKNFEGISEFDMEKLLAYNWPGNVRELMYCIERSAVLADGPMLHIPLLDPDNILINSDTNLKSESLALESIERLHILKVLKITKGKITGNGGAAELLNLKPSTLNFRIKKLGLSKDLRFIRDE